MNRKVIEKVVVSARISDEFDRLLQAYAGMLGIDKSELIVEAITCRVNELKREHGIPDSYYASKEKVS
jgi:hypothetical protein